MEALSCPECRHPIIRALSHNSDLELLSLFQRHPDSGRYFVAIYCRYSPIVYTLVCHSAPSPVQAEYLFAQIWQRVFRELGVLNLNRAPHDDTSGNEAFTLQNWLINMTALCINQADLPPVEAINYSLKDASPPLWCYLEAALDRQDPLARLTILMAQSLHWSEPRIAAYLQAEGEDISPAAIKARLRQGYRNLEAALPPDIRAIYLGEKLEEPVRSPLPVPPPTSYPAPPSPPATPAQGRRRSSSSIRSWGK